MQGLGYLPNLSLLRLNYKSRPVDQVVHLVPSWAHASTVTKIWHCFNLRPQNYRLSRYFLIRWCWKSILTPKGAEIFLILGFHQSFFAFPLVTTFKNVLNPSTFVMFYWVLGWRKLMSCDEFDCRLWWISSLPPATTWPHSSSLMLKKFTWMISGILLLWSSVAEPEPVEPKLFWDLEPEPKINFNKHFLLSVWRMLQWRKGHCYLY